MTDLIIRPKPSYVTIESRGQAQRLDNYLFNLLKGVPKSYVYKIIRKGEVRLDKKRVSVDCRLQEGQILRLPPIQVAQTSRLNPDQPVIQHSSAQAKILQEAILYEDNDLLVINKPAGFAVHGGSGIKLGIIETLRKARPKEDYLELVHRLDRETSGCLLLAKKPSILKGLQAQMPHDGENPMEKTYQALLMGKVKNQFTVDLPLFKQQLQNNERMVKVDKRGKPSTTRYRLLSQYRHASLVAVQLLTGRTHQIRVHSKATDHPVAGDEKYGDKDFNQQMKNLGLKRMFLHAFSLEFTHPKTRKRMYHEAPLDAELKKILERL
jgi:23S rRNA pseudouridine955/2504/2580 synthase